MEFNKHQSKVRVQSYGAFASFALIITAVALHSIFFGFIAVASLTAHVVSR